MEPQTSDRLSASAAVVSVDRQQLVQSEMERALRRRPPVVDRLLQDEQRAHARRLLREHDAALIAHYYSDAQLQLLAEESGGYVADSLEMARFGRDCEQKVLVVAGVRFMGETAKLLTPDKRVLMPDFGATCSLDLGCPPDAFADFCAQYPERTVVVYANTSVAVKSLSDWVVTSSIAADVIDMLSARGEKIIWAPDKYLGRNIQRTTGADMVFWDGSCIVHEEFKAQGLQDMRRVYPDAAVLAHPESPPAVVDLADFVGSTSQIIKEASRRPELRFIVATDQGIFYKLRQAAPDKELLIAPTAGAGASCRSCSRCPWMALNSVQRLIDTLENGNNEISIEACDTERALRALNRMLEFQIAQG